MQPTGDAIEEGPAPEAKQGSSQARAAVLAAARASAAAKRTAGPDAARSQDFPYDDDGLPG